MSDAQATVFTGEGDYTQQKPMIMSDNKKYRGIKDRNRVDQHDPSEVEWLHRQFPQLSHQTVQKAIHTAGPLRKNILQYLEKKC